MPLDADCENVEDNAEYIIYNRWPCKYFSKLNHKLFYSITILLQYFYRLGRNNIDY